MKIQKIKERSVLFTYELADWNLNIQLIIAKKHNYLIDAGLGSHSVAPILEYLESIDNHHPIIIINTHYHWDHVWGNAVFKDHMIISHTSCREILSQNWEEQVEKNAQYIDGDTTKCLPNVVFDQSFSFIEDQIHLFYSPGHTIDGISVYDELDKVLNVGDNIGDSIDDIIPSLSCSKEVYLASLQHYKTFDFDTCITGHNTLLDKAILDTIIEQVQIES